MFNYAPLEVFAPDSIPKLLNDFYVEPVQVSSGEEDLTTSIHVNVRLAYFGTCEEIHAMMCVYDANIIYVCQLVRYVFDRMDLAINASSSGSNTERNLGLES